MRTTADTVRVGVLGPLEVTDDAGRPVRVGGHRVRALLILLALDAGRAVPAHVLIGRLWPRQRPADAANALQSLVSRLRVALRQAGVPEGVLESSPAGYRLAVPPGAVDAMVFESRARAGSQALARGDAREAVSLLREALSAWRGSALADVAEEEFALAPATRLTELRAAATLDRIEADLALGGADAALIGELRALTAADELAERPAALLIRALAAVGRQSAALATYHRTRARLADRLGVDPSPQLEQAYLAVLRQEIPQAAPSGPAAESPASSGYRERARPPVPPDTEPARRTSAGLRPPPTSFVGRDDDVAGVLKRLAAERLVTLTGPGGVGKTRLATEVAARLAAAGTWFAALATVTDKAEVPYAVLDALGLRERSIARRGSDAAGDPLDRLCAALAERDTVLILDNCEHVVDAAAALAERLLTDCPRACIVATSREPLRVPGETLYVVAPLPAPPAAAAPALAPPAAAAPAPGPPPGAAEISAYPAVRLFADRAAAVVSGFELDAASAEAVARICRTLDGMPLAIELAAPWLRTLTPAQLAERLDDRFALLTGGSRTVLPRHQTLRAVVDWSWDLLSDQERTLARRLAVFPAGATLAAAEAVADQTAVSREPVPAGGQAPGTQALPAAAVLPTLGGLVAKSILTAAERRDGSEPRYRMLETVRAYCLERLAASEGGEDAAARDAATRYYLGLAETADPLLRTRTQARWFHVLAAEQDNVHAAIRWAIARGDAGSALRLVRALGYYWIQRGRGEADVLSRDVLAMPPPPLTKQLAEARVICALLAAGWSWDIGRIREPLTQALAALDAFGGDHRAGHPLIAMAEPLLTQYDGAVDLAEQQFERYMGAPDPWLRAIGKVSVCAYEVSLGKPRQAEEHCRAGLAELRALGEQWGLAMALTQLSDFAELRADHASAVEALTEAIEIGRELSVWGDLTYVEARLAVIHARAGELPRAREQMAQVREMVAVRSGQVDTDRWVAFMAAELAWRQGDYAEAARSCEAVLAAIAPHQDRWWQALRAQVKARLALAAGRLGDTERCARMLDEAIGAAASWREHPALATVLDACAAYLLRPPGANVPGPPIGNRPDPGGNRPDAGGNRPDPAGNRPDPGGNQADAGGNQADVGGNQADAGAAERAARLLGAAHAVRGAFDESSPDAPAARDQARAALGARAFAAAYASESAATYESAVALARDLLPADREICFPGAAPGRGGN